MTTPMPGLFAGAAWWYARYRPDYPEPFLRYVIARFGLDGTGRLLDVGCGTGQLALPLAPHVAAVVGMDPEPEMLAEGRRGRRRSASATRAGCGAATAISTGCGGISASSAS